MVGNRRRHGEDGIAGDGASHRVGDRYCLAAECDQGQGVGEHVHAVVARHKGVIDGSETPAAASVDEKCTLPV